jgi:hypothetical protein
MYRSGASLYSSYAPYSLLLISNKFWMGGGGRCGVRGGEARGPSWRGRIKGVKGMRGYFAALEGLVGVGEQWGNVILPHSSPPWSISG